MATYKSKIGGSFFDGNTKVKVPDAATTYYNDGLWYADGYSASVLTFFEDGVPFSWSEMREGSGGSSQTVYNRTNVIRSGLADFPFNLALYQLILYFNMASYISSNSVPVAEITSVKLKLPYEKYTVETLEDTIVTTKGIRIFENELDAWDAPITTSMWLTPSQISGLNELARFTYEPRETFSSFEPEIVVPLPLSVMSKTHLRLSLIHEINFEATRPSGFISNLATSLNDTFRIEFSTLDDGFVPVNNIGVQ